MKLYSVVEYFYFIYTIIYKSKYQPTSLFFWTVIAENFIKSDTKSQPHCASVMMILF